MRRVDIAHLNTNFNPLAIMRDAKAAAGDKNVLVHGAGGADGHAAGGVENAPPGVERVTVGGLQASLVAEDRLIGEVAAALIDDQADETTRSVLSAALAQASIGQFSVAATPLGRPRVTQVRHNNRETWVRHYPLPISADSFMRVLWPFGGSLLDDKFKSNLNSAGSQMGLQYRQDLMKYMPPGIVDYDHAEAVNALAQGNVAMISEWSAFYSTLSDPSKSRITVCLAVATEPAGPAGLKPALGGFSLGVNAQSSDEKKAAAWLFIQWVTSEEMAKPYIEAGGVSGTVSDGAATVNVTNAASSSTQPAASVARTASTCSRARAASRRRSGAGDDRDIGGRAAHRHGEAQRDGGGGRFRRA